MSGLEGASKPTALLCFIRSLRVARSISAKIEKRESYLLDSTRLTLTLALYPAYLSSVSRMNQMPAGSGVVSAFRGAREVGAREVGEQRRGGMFGTAERSGSRKSMKTNTMLGTRLPCRHRLWSFAAIPQFVVRGWLPRGSSSCASAMAAWAVGNYETDIAWGLASLRVREDKDRTNKPAPHCSCHVIWS
ncbi:hypothetical protein BDZ97DRAFT_886475 [Flammula alnicola]|nr:hypothetical protein BDZ97DRAFT_886475 [Flammula alnicola]